ncbi:hypothetical protein BVRB_9g204690 [Beta vulgaris subsp. vulgaris]|nr:hypothetical protein BVRB_9g204690 [Beta vulgaris subsp. vulgaris]
MYYEESEEEEKRRETRNAEDLHLICMEMVKVSETKRFVERVKP